MSCGVDGYELFWSRGEGPTQYYTGGFNIVVDRCTYINNLHNAQVFTYHKQALDKNKTEGMQVCNVQGWAFKEGIFQSHFSTSLPFHFTIASIHMETLPFTFQL